MIEVIKNGLTIANPILLVATFVFGWFFFGGSFQTVQLLQKSIEEKIKNIQTEQVLQRKIIEAQARENEARNKANEAHDRIGNNAGIVNLDLQSAVDRYNQLR